MRRTLSSRLMGLLLYDDATMIEFALTIIALFWGGWLLVVPEAFSVSQTFRVFQRLLPEAGWGITVTALGLMQLVAALSGKYLFRRILSGAGFFMWSTITGLYWLGNPNDLGIPTFAAVSLLSVLAFLHNGGTRE